MRAILRTLERHHMKASIDVCLHPHVLQQAKCSLPLATLQIFRLIFASQPLQYHASMLDHQSVALISQSYRHVTPTVPVSKVPTTASKNKKGPKACSEEVRCAIKSGNPPSAERAKIVRHERVRTSGWAVLPSAQI